MNSRIATWFPLFILAVLAALTFWLDRMITYSTIRSPNARHDPDYIVHRLSAVSMDTSGRIKQRLLADKMTHFPDDDTTLLNRPTFVSYTPERPSITITSESAQVSANGKDIHFHDNVRVTRQAAELRSEMTMLTSYLHVMPDSNMAVTDKAVRILDAYTVVDANGLELNGSTRILKLGGRVRGTYHDTSKASRR